MAASTRQKRIVAIVILSTLAVTAILFAQGTTHLLAAAFLSGAPSSDASARASAGERGGAAARPQKASADPILQRNIFDHEVGPIPRNPPPPPAPEVEPEQEEEELDPNAPPPPCDGSMRLVGAFVRVRRESHSFAAITDAAGASKLYQPGMRVDNREVVSIQRNRVILRPASGSLCSLSMFTGETRVATAAVSTPAQEPAKRRPSKRRPRGLPEGMSVEDLESGITKVSERQFTIERGLVNRLLEDQAAMMRTARVIPHQENGATVGVKLYGIRRSSLLGRLGIHNGDMLRTVNGFDMSSPDSALQAFTRLRNANRITINLARRGQDMTLDYQIR